MNVSGESAGKQSYELANVRDDDSNSYRPVRDIEDAPNWYRRAAQYFAAGYSPAEIAIHLQKSKQTVQQVLKDRVIARHVATLQNCAELVFEDEKNQWDRIKDKLLNRIEEAVDTPGLSASALKDLATLIFDRHHSGKYVKVEKQIKENHGAVFGDDEFRKMRQRAIEMGIESARRQAIPVVAEPVAQVDSRPSAEAEDTEGAGEGEGAAEEGEGATEEGDGRGQSDCSDVGLS